MFLIKSECIIVILIGLLNSVQLINYDKYKEDVLFQVPNPTPLQTLVDVTNDVAYNILYYHSVLNKNNFAFSPCGLGSVLIALYEGSAGHSSLEIHKTLNFPNDRDVIRIGYRDIHRRLRSYFYQHQENLLSGLSLSRENVTIHSEYETILRFYGYDLGHNHGKPNDGNTLMITTTNEPTVQSHEQSTETDNTSNEEEITAIQLPSTTQISDVPPNSIISTFPANIFSNPVMTVTTDNYEPTTQYDKSTDTTLFSTIPTTTQKSKATSYIYTFKPPTTMAISNTDTSDNIATALYSTTISTLSVDAVTDESTSSQIEMLTTKTKFPEGAETTVIPSNQTIRTVDPNMIFLFKPQRQQRIRQMRASKVRNNRQVDKRSIIRNPRSPIQYEISSYDEYIDDNVNVDFNYFFNPLTPNPHETKFENSENLGFESLQFNTKDGRENTISHFFYLSRRQTIQVPYKVYNTILRFSYIDLLQSSALELELDSPNYNLLILLPNYDYGLDKLLVNLRSGLAPSLRAIKKHMKYEWIKAIVPKFNLKGNIVLTDDLQNLGINDIFEPTRADFTRMTDDTDIYAKHIEQSINVNIRTHSTEHLKRHSSFYKTPIEMSINHPFLFFIIDNDLNVALIAGRILNPLNARIK